MQFAMIVILSSICTAGGACSSPRRRQTLGGLCYSATGRSGFAHQQAKAAFAGLPKLRRARQSGGYVPSGDACN